MISILLVEDEQTKRQLLTEAILEVRGMRYEDITIVPDVVGAKRELKQKQFDLLILDINLPVRADKLPNAEGGLEVVRWLKRSGKDHRPKYIAAVTAYEESHRVAVAEFDNAIWSLCEFSYQNSIWRNHLKQTISLILESHVPPYINDGRTFRYDLGIIVALDGVELESVLNYDVVWTECPVRFDSAKYYTAAISENQREIRIVAVAATSKGMTSAAIAATKLIYSFRPRCLAMAGICAGVREKTRLGDVVFADPVWDWGSGKIASVKRGEEFRIAPYQYRMSPELRVFIKEISADQPWLTEVKSSWLGPKPDNEIAVHVGATATGSSVLQSAKKIEELTKQHKDLLAIEMEIFSIMAAAADASAPRPQAFAVKGVCDFGDDEKSDDYQAYAAYVSVAVLFRFAMKVLTTDTL